MSETIEVMMGQELEDVIDASRDYRVLHVFNCDTGGGCDYCTCYIIEYTSENKSSDESE